jgi:hypothetical protein
LKEEDDGDDEMLSQEENQSVEEIVNEEESQSQVSSESEND